MISQGPLYFGVYRGQMRLTYRTSVPANLWRWD